MPKKKRSNNLNLAFLFLCVVFGLIILSVFFKFIFVIKNSKFDGNHRIIVAFNAKEEMDVVSFSPQNKTVSVLRVKQKIKDENIAKDLEVPVSGVLEVSAQRVDEKNLSSLLLHSEFSLGSSHKGLTSLDVLRLFLFSRSVSSAGFFDREFTQDLSDSQKSTIVSLSFTDPQIYQENQSVEVINATDAFGLGNRLANLITNIGGNVVLVDSAEENQEKSQIIYFKDKSYTVKYLSEYLGLKTVKSDKRGVADVIIILGKDSVSDTKF